MPSVAPPGLPRLPHPQQLAAMGAVLCLYRSGAGSELEGWSQAARVACERALDSDGLRESLQFFDGEGRCCWRLHLLPDTDFLAWEQAVAGLPENRTTEPELGIGERLWRRVARRLSGPGWRASVLRLHAVSGGPGFADLPLLAASLPRLSACGLDVAGRIVRREGIAGDALFDHPRGRDAASTMKTPEALHLFDTRMCA
jgi:hypothetical protein